jgi:crossover junction endodeoxyribonuclease RuvC
VLEYGAIRAKTGESLPLRLERIHRELTALFVLYKPSALALESIFFAKHARAALILGHARGAIMVAAQSQGVTVAEYAPRLVKQAATGKGGASKEQVAELIRTHLRLKSLPRPADAADALAIAYCHLAQISSPFTQAAGNLFLKKPNKSPAIL